MAQFEPLHHPAPQACATGSHVPVELEQSEQICPPVPHAVGLRPSKQKLPLEAPPIFLQHPFWQFSGLQSVCLSTQAFAPASQLENPDAWQSRHGFPELPQALASVPGRHTPFAPQQPLEQSLGEHCGKPAAPPCPPLAPVPATPPVPALPLTAAAPAEGKPAVPPEPPDHTPPPPEAPAVVAPTPAEPPEAPSDEYETEPPHPTINTVDRTTRAPGCAIT